MNDENNNKLNLQSYAIIALIISTLVLITTSWYLLKYKVPEAISDAREQGYLAGMQYAQNASYNQGRADALADLGDQLAAAYARSNGYVSIQTTARNNVISQSECSEVGSPIHSAVASLIAEKR